MVATKIPEPRDEEHDIDAMIRELQVLYEAIPNMLHVLRVARAQATRRSFEERGR